MKSKAGVRIKRGTASDALVGARIRAARLNAGMSLTSLGRATEISYQQIGKYEHGVNRVGPDRLQRIANATNHPINFFFEDIGANDKRAEAVTSIVELMGGSSALRRIIAGLSKLNKKDAKLVAGIVGRLATTTEGLANERGGSNGK